MAKPLTPVKMNKWLDTQGKIKSRMDKIDTDEANSLPPGWKLSDYRYELDAVSPHGDEQPERSEPWFKIQRNNKDLAAQSRIDAISGYQRRRKQGGGPPPSYSGGGKVKKIDGCAQRGKTKGKVR